MLLIVSNIVAAVAAVIFAILFFRYRQRLHRAGGRDPTWPIPTVRLQQFDACFAHDELGPTEQAEVAFIGSGDGVPGGTSDREAWILAVLAKRARSMFEFGTCTGRTAYLWARNSPPDARVATLTLDPGALDTYIPETSDDRRASRTALRESRFTRFRYSDTEVAGKVTQLFADSKAFDETPYLGNCDLVFVDGSHASSYVESDTGKALRMLAPGGIVLWHDYDGRSSAAAGVFRYLNELRNSLPLVHLQGTSLIAYRAPAATAGGASNDR